jgi:hypothetical protein
MIEHKASIKIKRPASEVADYVFDASTMPQWSALVQRVELVEPKSASAWRVNKGFQGKVIQADLKILGLGMRIRGEVIDFDPNKRRAVLRAVPIRGSRLLGRVDVEVIAHDSEGSTVLDFLTRVELPSGIAEKLSEKYITSQLDRAAEYGMGNIKQILEGRQENDLREFAVKYKGPI